MKFTRVNLIEAIIYIIESNPNESFELKKLYNKVKKVINILPDENIFKFQFIVTIKSIGNKNSVIKIRDYLVINNTYISDLSINYNNTIDIDLKLDFNDKNLKKKILIDIKNNSQIYDKLDRNIIFDILIKSL